MSFFSRKKHTEAPSTLAPASGLASSQVPPNLQSQSHLKSSQKIQQPEPVCPWSAHALPFGPSLQSLSPYLRRGHSLSTTATTVSDLFLFGGYKHSSKSPSNDLYVISTRDFSTTLLQTSGDVPCPRDGHRAVLTGTSLLIWGGNTIFDTQNAQNQSYDDSFYLLNLVSREWTRIVVDGPGPGGRYYHTMDLIGSKLFVFGGWSVKRYFNDIWALDLNCLTSNPFWESYGPAPGNKKPLPRAGHVSVTTGDRIIIHGGHANKDDFNDTWSFNISTQKWTELQCTGSIPSPCGYHVAVLIDDVMYVYGGNTIGGTYLGDLTALNMSTQRWTAFQDIGPSPSARFGHAMACDGARVFVLGGRLSAGARVVEAKPIHILDTKLLIYPKPDSNAVKHSEETTQLAQRLSAGHPTQVQPLDHPASLRITRDRTPDPNDLPSLLPGINDKPRRVPGEDDDSEGSTEHHAKFVAPDASEKEAARVEHERIADLERQLSETLAERAQLTDQLVQKSALLEQAEANAAEVQKRAGLEQRELQAKLDELLLSRDQALEQAQSALQKATFSAAEANERSQQELAGVHAKLEARESELAAIRLRLTDAEVGWAKSKADADTLRAGTQAAAMAGLVNMDVDQVMRRLMERVRSVEAEVASLRGDEKSIGEMECRNEG